jgi:molybdopterin synthase sulfur carrier subunit
MASAPKPREGHFNVLYFAGASTFTGKDHESLPGPLALGSLFPQLEAMYPGFQSRILDSCLVTVNLEYVDLPRGGGAEGGSDGGLVIQSGDEVAIIPPVSSG